MYIHSCVLQNYCTCRALPTQDPLLGTFQVFGRLSSATCDFVAMDVQWRRGQLQRCYGNLFGTRSEDFLGGSSCTGSVKGDPETKALAMYKGHIYVCVCSFTSGMFQRQRLLDIKCANMCKQKGWQTVATWQLLTLCLRMWWGHWSIQTTTRTYITFDFHRLGSKFSFTH